MATITLERDGLQLVGTREDPFGEIYDMAIIFHGFTANRNTSLLKEIANSLRDENIASVRFDFNGHGDSDGKFENMTVLNEIEDANAILNYVKTDPHVRNIYLVGHSQGGVVASMLARLSRPARSAQGRSTGGFGRPECRLSRVPSASPRGCPC